MLNEYQKLMAYNKCVATIKSCKTKAQLRVAENMTNLFLSRVTYNYDRLNLYLKRMIQNHSINCI